MYVGKIKTDKYKYIGVKCKTPGCGRKARANGYCKYCYNKKYYKKKVNKNAIR